jgi:hypothetical protein
MDLSLSQESYRGFRFPWVGRPSDPPSVAARVQNGGTMVWASWNGATQVATWRVLAGATAATLSVVGAPVKTSGFETTITLSKSYGVVEVQALNSAGQVLGTSTEVAPAS